MLLKANSDLEFWASVATIVSAFGTLIAFAAFVWGVFQYRANLTRLKKAEILKYEERIFDLRTDLMTIYRKVERAALFQEYLIEISKSQELQSEDKLDTVLQSLEDLQPGMSFDLEYMSNDDLAEMSRAHVYREQYFDNLFHYLIHCDKLAELWQNNEKLMEASKNTLIHSLVVNALDEYGSELPEIERVAKHTSESFKNLKSIS